MGNCISTTSVIERRASQDDDPERQMREAKKQLTHTAKVLLLGTGDSGKSTILKQMRVINSIPWSSTEIESYRQIIWVNLIEGMSRIRQVIDELSIQTSEDTLARFDQVARPFELGGQEAYPPGYQHVLQTLWEDSAVQKAISKGRKLALPDNLSYFFNDLPRLFNPTYVPSTDDIIFARARTMGISEMHFTMPGPKKLVMIDVGGQKSERRKWIHCFQDVTAVLFLVSLSGYDQCLVEECNANQMMDAMGVWDSICSSQWFRKTSLILFLNKEDLFRDRIQYSPIRNFFPDYDGPENDADAGMQYFRRRFVRLTQKANRALERKAAHGERQRTRERSHDLGPPPPPNTRQVYPHFTTAVDTNHIRIVMGAVNDIILREHFQKSAIL